MEEIGAPSRFPTFRVWSGDFAAEIRAAVEQAERESADRDAPPVPNP